jgi:hypothetical protein
MHLPIATLTLMQRITWLLLCHLQGAAALRAQWAAWCCVLGSMTWWPVTHGVILTEHSVGTLNVRVLLRGTAVRWSKPFKAIAVETAGPGEHCNVQRTAQW